jgi:glycerophosphoryl diester phosphodiesterase
MALLIAHRGSHQRAPENTLAAFAAAADHGADMVEFDVRRTADGQLAIFHDSECARTPLGKLTLAELRRVSGIDVPVLTDVLAWATEAGMGLDVEVKEDGYVDTLAPLLAAFSGEMIVTSFLDPVLGQFAEAAPELPRGLLLNLTTLGATKRASQCGAHAAVIKMKLMNERIVADLAEAGLGTYLWDFLPARDAAWLDNPLIAGFITDDVPGTRAARV